MVRLGSVVGGILAELTQARVVADRLTRVLVDEYEDDPILSGMSVPRVKLSEATVTVRYTIQDIEEPEPAKPDPVVVGIKWQTVATNKVIPSVLRKLHITDEDHQTLKVISVKRPSVSATEHALQGNPAELVNATVESALEAWPNIPVELHHRLGGKVAFRAELKAAAVTELEGFLAREARDALLAGVLASRVQVGVLAADLPDEPFRIQEIQLTVTGEELDLVVLGDQEG
ncbi:hypothetical protein ACFVAV_17860 [Nocardia sp. NPDC057663]|uniref:hypothetical protein n=1 Tax=Nocardia sp. NPDC057663 TaxID=3346201 RepID=UPI003670E740